MIANRVLFLGITGVDKVRALRNLAGWQYSHDRRDWQVIDFEKDYLWFGKDEQRRRETFLNSPLDQQIEQWDSAWKKFLKNIRSPRQGNRGIFLSLHGSFIRGHYGVRSVFDPGRVAKEFKPDLIVTLIADVYDMWWRTERRAGGVARRGQPTLEQLIFARRHELLVGDQIALACDPRIKNLMLPIAHPIETLAHYINHPSDHQTVYLSFPISQPRKSERDGDLEPRRAVSSFIKAAYERQARIPQLVLECPLGIDEIPFLNVAPPLSNQELANEDNKSQVYFDREALRWNLEEFWPASTRLGLPTQPDGPFSARQLSVARGNINTDVTWRDYRLVDQAEILLVFNPIFNNRDYMAQSVRMEIDYAIHHQKYVYLYQDPKHDPRDIVGLQLAARLEGPQSTMEENPSRQQLVRKRTVEELLDVLTALQPQED
jgi:hypothetical protein